MENNNNKGVTNDFWVECAVCHQQLKNWTGSTPCCGSIAYIVEDGKTTDKLSLFASLGGGEIKPTVITPSKEVERGEGEKLKGGMLRRIISEWNGNDYDLAQECFDEGYDEGFKAGQSSAPLPEGKGVEVTDQQLNQMWFAISESWTFDSFKKKFREVFATPNPSPKGVEGLQWVKASERLPEVTKANYIFRQSNNTRSARSLWFDHYKDDISKHLQLPIDKIEWLSENK